jgi:AraC-like DNA-binding protein
MQLIFDIRKKFRFRTQNAGWGIYKALIIKENVIHQLDTNHSVQLIIYVDAGSDIAKAIRSKYLRQGDFFSPETELLNFVKPGELEQCLIEPDKGLLEKLVRRILEELAGNKNIAPPDERVKKVIGLLAGEHSGDLTITELSGKVFLSESRLRALFVRSTGVSLHRYIIWNKITHAISKIMNGATVAEAAIGCGFSDSSHFHKMTMQLFGISPSQFIRDNRKRNTEICNPSPLSLITSQYDERSWNIERVFQLS